MARREKAVHSAEYWEKRARRKKLARQKQLRRRMLIAAAVCLVLAVVIGVLVRIGSAHEEPAVSTTREPVVVTPEDRCKHTQKCCHKAGRCCHIQLKTYPR